MKRSELERIVADVMRTLPPAFAPYLTNLAVDVERRPSRRTLRELGITDDEIADGETVYGLFVPCPFGDGPELGGIDAEEPPMNRIIVYREPLVEDFPDEHELRAEIRTTVIHELAHHFGWTERDMEAFGID